MVSIHKVPVIVYLIIRVISSTFRFKREALHCRSLHSLRLWQSPNVRNEQRRTPRRYVDITPQLYRLLAHRYTNGYTRYSNGMYITHLRGIHVALFFDIHS